MDAILGSYTSFDGEYYSGNISGKKEFLTQEQKETGVVVTSGGDIKTLLSQ